MVVGDFGEQLDEIERPVAPWILGGVRKSIIPRLELVEQQRSGLRFEHLKEQVDVRHVSLGRVHALPLALDERALGMALEKDVPKKFEPLLVEAFGDDQEVG